MNECVTDKLSWKSFEEKQWLHCYFGRLVPLYRKSPCLWKKDTKYYLDSERRHEAYSRIHQAMALSGVTFVDIVLRIRQMRQIYAGELKKLLDAETSGHCYCTLVPWFYDLHRFLYPYLDYDEAIELHNPDQTIAKLRETSVRNPCRNPSNCCCCVDCPASTNNVNPRKGSLTRNREPCDLYSISSPNVSLPEVEPRSGNCSRSCSKITCARKQFDRVSSRGACVSDSDTSDEMSKQRGLAEELTRRKQDKCHEFKIYGLCSTSDNDSCGTDSDQLEAFSMVVTHYLKKLDKRCAMKAQAEIQNFLANFVIKSNVITSNC